MKFQHLRNATAILEYAGERILIDPMFAPKHGLRNIPSFTGSKEVTPLVDLPLLVEDIVEGITAVIVTHTHPDHWDPFAAEVLDKRLPIFVQSVEDQKLLESQGFEDVTVLSASEVTLLGDIALVKTPGHHGTQDQILRGFGDGLGLPLAIDLVMGAVLRHHDEKTVYISGDTVWYDGVDQTLETYKPEVVVVNGGAARLPVGDDLTMTVEDIEQVVEKVPTAKVIAVHYGAVNHYTQTREDLDQYAKDKGFRERLEIPEDGDILIF